ncbi:MAG: flagellar hook-associated protein FlgK [Chitinivibrionales bacterium]
MGLFSVLNVGTRGLAASQLGMDVTGQNISNADVEGYSRKRLNTTASYRGDDSFGQMGFGVEVKNIERIRNTYIDQQIRRQNQEVGFFSEADHTLEAVENILTEPSDTGLMEYIDQFFDSWENLANNPSDMAARTMVQTNGNVLTDVFHNLSGELRDLKDTRNDEIRNRVDKINQITAEIHNLNTEIASVEINDQNANDSRDHRDRLLKELSSIIEIDVTENERGQITVTTSGNILVSPVDVQEVELTTTQHQRSDGTSHMELGVRFANSKRDLVPTGGELKGLIDSRDILIPSYEKQLDTLAQSLVSEINQIHHSGYTLEGYTGIDFFEPDPTGASDISLSASILSDVKNIAAAQGGETRQATETGISHTYGNNPVSLAHRDIQSITVTNEDTGVVLTEGVDYAIDNRMGTFQLLNSSYDGVPMTIEYSFSTGGFAGAGDNANALAIGQLRHAQTMNADSVGEPTATFNQFYSSFIGTLGINRNEASSNLQTRKFLVEQYETHQDSIAGVSLDEEMAEMIKFQHTYQAAARVISTADRMLEVLMNM